MIQRTLIVLAVIGLAGCQAKPFPDDGPEMIAPIGYVEMCIREPESVFCP